TWRPARRPRGGSSPDPARARSPRLSSLRLRNDHIKWTDQKLDGHQSESIGDALVPRRRDAVQVLVELGPLVEQLQVVLPGVADRAVQRQCTVGDPRAGRGDLRL